MKKFLVYLIVTLILNVFSFSQEKISVTIKVIADSLPSDAIVYIAGNDDSLGNWNPVSIMLNKKENDLWKKTFLFEKGKIKNSNKNAVNEILKSCCSQR